MIIFYNMTDVCDLDELNKLLQINKEDYSFDVPKVSVIIPAYNIENYITDCLMSIKNQTLKEIEIIVVNDGSTDKTADIVEIFSKNDSRIKLINQKNQKVGMARNNGMQFAKGKYIIFVDSDDEIENTALEELYNIIFTKNIDIVSFGALNIKGNKYKVGSYSVEKIPSNLKNKVLSHEIIQKNIFRFPILCMCKIYKRDFLEKNNIKFQAGCSGEDQIFHIKSILLADKVFLLNKNLYKYRRNRKDSLTFSKYKKDNSPIMNFYEIEKFIKNSDFKTDLKYKILDKYFIKVLSWLGKCSPEYRHEYCAELKKLQIFINENYSQYYWKYIKFVEKSSYLQLKFAIIKEKFLRGKNGR